MNTNDISAVATNLSSRLFNGSHDFEQLCNIKKEIQEKATNMFSQGELMAIAQSVKSETVISKLTKIGREIYHRNQDNLNLYLISFAIATIIKEYKWDYNHFSNAYLSEISERVEKPNYDLKVKLESFLQDISVYCQATKNSLRQNNVQHQPYFIPEVNSWKHAYEGKPYYTIYNEIARIARNSTQKSAWDEYDVDGFSWTIGVFSLICESAGLVPSFEEAFRNSYRIYIQTGLDNVGI